MAPVLPFEEKLAGKLFGAEKLKKLGNVMAPMAMILFCHNKEEGFVGDDIGISEKICDDFFPAPTDNGICLTSNMNPNSIAHINDEYR